MAERIYLQEWFYNAGIVGLLRLLGGETVKGERLLNKEGLPVEGVKIGENYVEVERQLFKDFAKKYYTEAAKREVEFRSVNSLKVGESEESLKRAKDTVNRLLKELFPHLKGEVELPKRVSKKNLGEASRYIRKAAERVEEEKEKLLRGELPLEAVEHLAKRWLKRGFFSSGGSNKLYESLKNLQEKVEVPLITPPEVFTVKKRKLPCLLCQERFAKEGVNLSKAISDLVGFNKDNLNLLHLKGRKLANKGLPICEICQAVISLIPLGVVRFGNSFLFINNTTSVQELFSDNQRLRRVLSSSSPLFTFFAEKVLAKEEESAKLISLLGTSVVEMELGALPKVKGLNISYELAELLSDPSFTENLRKLTKAHYRLGSGNKKKSFNLLVEFLENLIQGRRNYSYLYKLFRFLLTADRNREINVAFSPLQLHTLNLALFRAKANLEGRMNRVSENELWSLFYGGQELRRVLTSRGAENRVNSLAFKLLNALKVGDSHRFMDIILRVYAGFSLKVPKGLVKNLEDREAFKSAGYSFIAGLLNEKREGGDNED
ncbi:type I-B CRISPR-associated protein Cas8b1/Cst1 [Thermovibrio ammonificans]